MGSTKAHSVTDSTIPPTVCKLSSWQLKKKRVIECTIFVLLEVVSHYRDDEYR